METDGSIRGGEYWRKAVHSMGILFIPFLIWNRFLFTAFVGFAFAVYLTIEILEKRGKKIPILSNLAARSKRTTEAGQLSKGAIALFLTSLALPYLVGAWPAAVGLTQIYVADVSSAFVGMKWGSKKLPYSSQKSWIGSLAYLITAYLVALPFVSPFKAVILAAVGTVVESLPIPEIDNLTVPFAVSTVVLLLA